MSKFFTAKTFIPFIVSCAFFMEALDSTILNTALPAMSVSLRVNPIDLKIALISYLLSLAIFIPISGWVGDKFGIKKIFILALGLFTLSSIWCGFAHHVWELVLARTIQGIGGSFTVPIGRLILLRAFERHQVINVMNRVVLVGGLGVMLGPVLGGLITHYFSWHWIFWVNIPIGLLTILIAKRGLPFFAPQKIHQLDIIGFILFGAGLACFTFGLSAFSESTVSNFTALLIILAAVFLLFLYYWHSRSRKHPIIKSQLFSYRTFKISVSGNLLARMGFGGVPFLVPLLLQVGLGYSPQTAGLLLAPTALGIVIVKFFSMRLLRLLGYKRLLLINTILLGLSLCSFMLIDATTPFYIICCFTFLFGFLTSLQYGAMNSLAYAEISAEHLSSATSIMGTIQQLAQSFGVAIAALIIRLFTSFGSQTNKTITLTPALFHHTFFVMGCLTILSTLIFMKIKRNDGEAMLYRS